MPVKSVNKRGTFTHGIEMETAKASGPPPVTSFYMNSIERRFGAWRLDDTAQNSAVRFSIFFPDRGKDPAHYENRPDVAGGHCGDPHIQSIQVVGDFQDQLGQKNRESHHSQSFAAQRGDHGLCLDI